MTTNAFLFVWDELGIESIVPITQYEKIDKLNLINILKESPVVNNPLDLIIRSALLRARLNPQRHYEIYAVDCSEDLNEEFWKEQWKDAPQFCAELVRAKGEKIYSNREDAAKIKIT
jgi:hypothetical protein